MSKIFVKKSHSTVCRNVHDSSPSIADPDPSLSSLSTVDQTLWKHFPIISSRGPLWLQFIIMCASENRRTLTPGEPLHTPSTLDTTRLTLSRGSGPSVGGAGLPTKARSPPSVQCSRGLVVQAQEAHACFQNDNLFCLSFVFLFCMLHTDDRNCNSPKNKWMFKMWQKPSSP